MSQIRSVCVLCGSRLGNDPKYAEAAALLGRIVGERGMRLVFGAGSIGLMGVVADAVLEAGGEAIGIIPDFLMRYEIDHRTLTDLIITDSMHDRKRRMFEMADGFVTLPGGLGTLDETFEIVTWKQLRLHSKPIVVLDTGGYWGPLKQLIETTIAGEFAHPAVAQLITIVTSAEEVLPALEAAPEPKEEVLTSHL